MLRRAGLLALAALLCWQLFAWLHRYVVAYAYLTLDKAPPPHALGAFLGADGVHFDGSIGVRVLFSFIVGALGVFNRLAGDLNRTDAASRDCFV